MLSVNNEAPLRFPWVSVSVTSALGGAIGGALSLLLLWVLFSVGPEIGALLSSLFGAATGLPSGILVAAAYRGPRGKWSVALVAAVLASAWFTSVALLVLEWSKNA